MTSAPNSRDKLYHQARLQFWARGYSNVSLRDLAKAAGVDVALISRHFGGKLGLFEATLVDAFDFEGLPDPGSDGAVEALMDLIVALFTAFERDCDAPSLVQMILMNAHDPDVGALVRARHQASLQSYFEAVIGDKPRAALFMAVLLGISVAEKTLLLDGIAAHGTEAYVAQLRYMMRSALAFSN